MPTDTNITPQPPTSSPLGFHTLTVGSIRELTDDAIEIGFSVPEHLVDAYRHQHGQHLTLKLTIDGEELRRSYSITSAVGDDRLCIAVKRVPGGRSSVWLTTELAVGDQLEVMTPAGRFSAPLDASATRHWLLIAAGSGITPILSIARSVLSGEPQSRVTLLYGNRDAASVMFQRELDDLKSTCMTRFAVHHFLSRGRRNLELFDGRIDGSRLTRVFESLVAVDDVDLTFVCGPEQMTLDILGTLTSLGIPRERIHMELFGTADTRAHAPHQTSPTSDQAEAIAQATIRLHGVERTIDMRAGERILDAALRNGMDVPYACAGGVCATCRAHLDSGSVTMNTNHALDDHEVADGFVLTCQATPDCDELRVDYDRA
mgnify:CR=1 FL=1